MSVSKRHKEHDMQHTTQSTDDVSEFGRMVEFRVKPDAYWGLGREDNLQRQRPRVLRNMILIGERMTLVLTPEI
jgi:hypothetical protein